MTTKTNPTKTRQINTEQPTKQPCCRLNVCWIQHLLVILGGIRYLCFFWKCLGTNRISQDICLRMWFSPSIEKPQEVWLRTSRQMFHLSNSPLFEFHICTPAGHAHYWHTSSSGHNAPLGLFARGKQLQNHLQDWERNHIKQLFIKEMTDISAKPWTAKPQTRPCFSMYTSIQNKTYLDLLNSAFHTSHKLSEDTIILEF